MKSVWLLLMLLTASPLLAQSYSAADPNTIYVAPQARPVHEFVPTRSTTGVVIGDLPTTFAKFPHSRNCQAPARPIPVQVQPLPLHPMLPPRPAPAPPGNCDHSAILAKLDQLLAAIEAIQSPEASIDQESINAIAIEVANRIEFPDNLVTRDDLANLEIPPPEIDLSGLATNADITQILKVLSDLQIGECKVDLTGLATKQDLDNSFNLIVNLLQSSTPGVPTDGNHKEIILALQRNAQALESLSARVDLLKKSQDATTDKVKTIELNVQDHTVSLQSLINQMAGLKGTLNDAGKRTDGLEQRIRELTLQVQKMSASSSSSSASTSSDTVKAQAKFRIKLDESGNVLGIEPRQ